MVGTVSYMPPEQAMGGEVTPRSDLYSLGAMLYELVTGRPPFVGDESVAIITQHLNTPPVAPSWHVPDLPPGLESLILRMLEKDPSKRPSTAAEVRQFLKSMSSSMSSPVANHPSGAETVPANEAIAENPMYRRTFVGREQELRQLQRAFDAALSGQGSLIAVVGEPGIGKTALCEQISTYAAVRGGKTLVGHCYEEGSLSLPYLPFIEALRTYVLARDPDGLKQDLGSGAAEVARIVSEVRDRVTVELRQSSPDPDEDRWRLYQALSGFLHNASSVQPLLVILEDLHWADRGTIDLLVFLSRQLAGARLLVVGNYRDVEVDRAHPLSGALGELRRGSTFQRIPLRGLTADEVQRMMGAVAGQEVTWSLAEAVHRQTEGNPLFVQEVLRYLAEEGLVTRADGRWQRAANMPLELQIPEGLRDVIGKRLSRLSPECNRVLAVAAVIGRDFALETLRALATVPEEALVEALEQAVHIGVLEEQTAIGGSVRYRFSHAFFRQTLYEEMIAPRRLRLHQEVARAIEAQYASRLPDHAVELAEHFGQSTDHADLVKAVTYSVLAAERAMAVYAHGEAARLLDHALKVQEVVDPGDAAKRCDLLLALGGALEPAGGAYRVATEIAPEALALAEQAADRPRASRACEVALSALFKYGIPGMSEMHAEYRDWAQRADRYADDGTPARVRADLAMSSALVAEGRNAESWALTQRALRLAREQNDRDALFHAAFRICVGRWQTEHAEEVYRVAQEFATLPRDGVSAYIQSETLWHGGDVYLRWAERNRAEDLWAQAERLTQLSRDPLLLLHSGTYASQRAFLDGQLEETLAEGERIVRESEQLGVPVSGRVLSAYRCFRAKLCLGRAEEVLADLPPYVGGPANMRSAPRRLLALAHLGRLAEGRSLLSEVLATHLALAADEIPDDDLVGLLEAATLLDDSPSTALLLPFAVDMPFPIFGRVESYVDLIVGDAARLLGDFDLARVRYTRALDVAKRVCIRPEVARTHLSLAELLLGETTRAAGAPAEHIAEVRAQAQAHLDFAIDEFSVMKMQPSLERALRHKGLLHA
jgi:tetratricopeptide (TPR) repeat protein